MRPLGAVAATRRPAIPGAVRAAQVALVTRMSLVLGLVLAGVSTPPGPILRVPSWVDLTLPSGAHWAMLAPWVTAATILEASMVLRLGGLRGASRRLVLLLESLAIAACGLYVAAGVAVALMPLVAAIIAVVLLRLDHVRHSFARAAAERRLLGSRVAPSRLYAGYAPADPLSTKPSQTIGYRVDRSASDQR